ncbi:MAG: protein kinase [Caldimonas sp.]
MILDAVADWQALSTLYEEADALDDAARAAWLAQLRTERHRLLPQVERMLAARARIGSDNFLEALPVFDTGHEPAPSEWGEGSRIGAYRLVRHLGSGGMAEVWLADRVDGAFERKVAIKLLFDHPSRARREAFVERFRRERDILASLDHPNIARLHDAGVTPSGQPWLALEFIEGRTIVDWCDERKLSVKARVTLFEQVLDAVAHAHRQLIVHRDLKPANILVSRDGTVHLLDFGIAKLLDPEDGTSEDTELTRSAGRLMTLQYASPEQILGESLSTASDQYSASTVLYQLVCGGRSHVADRKSGIGLEQAILEFPARAPGRVATDEAAVSRSETNAASLRKAIGRDLDAILLFALEKSPSRRYPTVEALRADLGRWQRGLPIEARPTGAAERAFKFMRRHPLGVGLGFASIGVLMATTAVAVNMSLSAQREARRAVAARDFLLQIFQQGDPDQARGKELNVKEILRSGRLKAETTLGREPKLQAELMAAIGSVQKSIGDRVEADHSFRRAVEAYSRQGLRREAAQTQFARVANLVSQGEYVTAGNVLSEAEAMVRSLPPDDELLAMLHDMKGTVAWQNDRLADAAQSLSAALHFARTGFGTSDVRTIDVLTSLAGVEAELKRTDQARAHSTEALRLSMELAASAPSSAVPAAAALAKIEVLDGRLNQGVQVLEQALAHCARTKQTDTEACAVLRVRLALLCLRMERKSQAAALLTGILPGVDQEGSPRHQADSMITAVRVFGVFTDDARSEPLQERLRLLRQAIVPGHGNPDTRALATLALTEVSLRRGNSLATDELERTMAEMDTVERLDPSGTSVLDLKARAQLLRGIALTRSGRAQEGLVSFKRAHDAFIVHYGDDHPFSLLVQLDQTIALCALGRADEARNLAHLAVGKLAAKLPQQEQVVMRWQDFARSGTGSPTTPCDHSTQPYFY